MADPTPYNASNPAHVKSRRRKDDRVKKREEAALKFVLSDARGRHFVWLVLCKAGKFQDCFTGDGPRTDYNCGRRSVALQWEKIFQERFPDEYAELEAEQKRIEASDRKLDEAARTEPIAEKPEEGGDGISL